MARPDVSVVVPFHGDDDEAGQLVAALRSLSTRDGDELIVADNTAAGVFSRAAAGTSIVVVPAQGELSPAHARNAGAERSGNAWLAFVDADCRPDAGLIDAYFAAEIASDVGAVAGRIEGAEERSLLGRYGRSRGLLDQQINLSHPYRPFAVTANLLVRREVWEALGGFYEGVRAGEDNDFCWRMQAEGWRLDYRDAAVVGHVHRQRLRPFLRQQLGYGAGRAWIDRHHPGSEPRPRVAVRLARCAAGICVWTVTLRFERALFKGVDAALILAEAFGYFRENRPRPGLAAGSDRRARTVVLLERFPRLGDASVTEHVRALVEAGRPARIEAIARPARQDRTLAQAIEVRYVEDDGIARRVAASATLGLTRPLTVAGDLRSHRRASPGPELSLLELAPLVRRLRRDRVRDLSAGDPGSANLAQRVGRLAGIAP